MRDGSMLPTCSTFSSYAINEHTFRIERRILGHGETQSWELTVVGKRVDISFESTDGTKGDDEPLGATADGRVDAGAGVLQLDHRLSWP